MEIIKRNMSNLANTTNDTSRIVYEVKFSNADFPHHSLLPASVFEKYPVLKEYCGTSKDTNLSHLFTRVIQDGIAQDDVKIIENLFARVTPLDEQAVKKFRVTNIQRVRTAAFYLKFFSHLENPNSTKLSFEKLHEVLWFVDAVTLNGRDAHQVSICRVAYDAIVEYRLTATWAAHMKNIQNEWCAHVQKKSPTPIPYFLNTLRIISELAPTMSTKADIKENQRYLSNYRTGFFYQCDDVKRMVESGLRLDEIMITREAGFLSVEEIVEIAAMPREWLDCLIY
jgi:hypothetical protein